MTGDVENLNLDKIFRFRKFPVYRDGRKFVLGLKNFLKKRFPKEEMYELRSQIWRALDSFLLNIAEGSDRGSDRDFAKFLNQSHTSLSEVVACLDIALDNDYISISEHQEWLLKSAALVSQLTAFRRILLSDSKNIVQKSKINSQQSEVSGQRSKVKGGFTLIELLIAIGITLVLAAAASPIYGNLQVSTQLNESSAQITQDLRLAREQSRAGVNGAAHGIKFEANQYTVFQGVSYAARNSAYDRVNTFSDALSIATTFTNNEIVFSAGTGAPSAAGVVTITHTVNGSRAITVNTSGAITE